MEEALQLAGENRLELELVLDHYRFQHKQKYEAASFLIANMPYHKSKQQVKLPEAYDDFFAFLDSTYRYMFDGMTSDSILKITPKIYDSVRREIGYAFQKMEKPAFTENSVSDIKLISSDFLIEHIDHAFLTWEESPLLVNMSFEDFKEFVLPYRTTNEELMTTRPALKKQWNSILIHDGLDDIRKPLNRYKAFIGKCRWLNKYTKPESHAAMHDLIFPKFSMNCHSLTNWSVNILRSCGIPVVYEYTPQWRDRNSRHFWGVSPDSSGTWQPYTTPDNNLRENLESDIIQASKVYRRTFGVNKNTPYFLASSSEFVPKELSSPLLIDQTWRYHKTITLRMPFPKNEENKVAYLCLFQGEELYPVAWGKIDKQKQEAVFEQVPLNTVFVPVYYIEEESCIIFSSPFVIRDRSTINAFTEPLTKNKQEKTYEFVLGQENDFEQTGKKDDDLKLEYIKLSPLTQSHEEMTVTRKYPEKLHLKQMQKGLKNSYFVGIEGKRKDTLAFLDNAPIPYWQEVALGNHKPYRYYRFYTHDGGPIHMAEMEFLGNATVGVRYKEPSPLPIFSPQDTNRTDQRKLYHIIGEPQAIGSYPHYVYDGDIATVGGTSRTGIDFGRPVVITHVRFVPRTADNGIVPDDEYRLYYFDGRDWRAHETKKAKFNFISFKNVPSGTVYWLRNISNGREELPFLYENGQQKFIHAIDQ